MDKSIKKLSKTTVGAKASLYRCGLTVAILFSAILTGWQSVKGFGGGALSHGSASVYLTETDGTYGSLDREQKRLVDAWFREYNRVTGESLDPKKEYEELALSVRTTFEAVTNALIRTSLADSEGKSLGKAVELVEAVESVKGKVPNAGGDKQFRIYARLKEDAVSRLTASDEFQRGTNNSFFHKGFPQNFRLKGGTPSIQFSISEDGLHADIDVDYRSSSFPASLLNGHLTAGNSDVRAGGNFDRHISRWEGLGPWWEGPFGAGTDVGSVSETESIDIVSIPKKPLRKEKSIAKAARAFLQSWMVEKQPGNATAYFSDASFPCVTQAPGKARKTTNERLVPAYLYKVLERNAEKIGDKAQLLDAIESVELTVEGLQPVEHDDQRLFSLYKVPEDLAFQVDCANRYSTDKDVFLKIPKRKYGKYYGVSFRINDSGTFNGSNLILLFKKESGYWKIVSWEVEPDEVKGRRNLDLADGAAKEAGTENKGKAPESLISDSSLFFKNWLIKRDFAAALGSVSQRAYPCVELYPGEDTGETADGGDELSQISAGLKRIATSVGKKKTLSSMISRVDIVTPELLTVAHGDESAYTLFTVPRDLAESFDCTNKLSSGDPRGNPISGGGEYFGTSFRINDNTRGAALNLLWQREGNAWKIVSFSVVNP